MYIHTAIHTRPKSFKLKLNPEFGEGTAKEDMTGNESI
jgi:hypothetical protein